MHNIIDADKDEYLCDTVKILEAGGLTLRDILSRDVNPFSRDKSISRRFK